MAKAFIYSAIGTPLEPGDELNVGGLEAHIEDHARASIDGLLVGGTMGCMQMLSTRAYAALAAKSVEFWRGRGEILVGVGDLSFARTRDRIHLCNELKIDGVVALTPFFFSYTQSELIQYFEALAAESRAPLFLYDLPQRTGIALEVETVQRLAAHPNIAGIKCSGDVGQTRRLMDCIAGSDFRVVVAQAPLMDFLIRNGVRDFLDGVYCIVPKLVREIADTADRGDWAASAARQQLLNGLLSMLRKYGVFQATTALLNHRGIPGNFAPRPMASLTCEQRDRLLAEPAAIAALDAA